VRKAKPLFNDLKFDKSERPIVAQLFGIDPDAFREAAKIIFDLGFDGVDINMGCPAKNVVGRGGGASLIKNYSLTKEIVEAVKDGVEEKIPISVKTRIGYEKIDFDWIKRLAELDLAVIAVHGRTFRQGYGGQADWETLGKMAEIVRLSGSLFLGNGDIERRISNDEFLISNGKRIKIRGKFDGVLIGQAARGNPWVFKIRENEVKVSFKEKMKVAIEHARKFEELNSGKSMPTGRQAFVPMRKHLAWYCRDFPAAAELRRKLVLTNSSEEARLILEDFCAIK
jgi:tRNA-dihydrouridine synthase B